MRALVVGVGEYTAPGLRLENPPEDARAIAETLKRLGASVTLLLDPSRSQLRDALEAFSTPQVPQARSLPLPRNVARLLTVVCVAPSSLCATLLSGAPG